MCLMQKRATGVSLHSLVLLNYIALLEVSFCKINASLKQRYVVIEYRLKKKTKNKKQKICVSD